MTAQALPGSQHPTACTDCEGALFVAFWQAGIAILGSLVRLLYPLNLKEHEFFWPGKQLAGFLGFACLFQPPQESNGFCPGTPPL